MGLLPTYMLQCKEKPTHAFSFICITWDVTPPPHDCHLLHTSQRYPTLETSLI
jgi:hypothetical protein